MCSHGTLLPFDTVLPYFTYVMPFLCEIMSQVFHLNDETYLQSQMSMTKAVGFGVLI